MDTKPTPAVAEACHVAQSQNLTGNCYINRQVVNKTQSPCERGKKRDGSERRSKKEATKRRSKRSGFKRLVSTNNKVRGLSIIAKIGRRARGKKGNRTLSNRR